MENGIENIKQQSEKVSNLHLKTILNKIQKKN